MIRTLFCLLLAAQIYAADPRLGTWKLVSVEATMDPPNMITIPIGESKLDDRDYPFPASRAYDRISGHRTDANTVDGVLKKDGKEAATYRFEVSEGDPDRLRMTTTPIGGAPTGGLNTDQFYTRKGQSPDSSNKVIGVWVRDESHLAHDELRAFKFTAEGANSVHFEATGGPLYTATLDGR